MKTFPPYLFVRLAPLFAEKRVAGWGIIDFGIGNPDLPTPRCIVDVMCEEARINRNQKYSISAGERDLRQAVAGWYGRKYGVDIDPDTPPRHRPKVAMCITGVCGWAKASFRMHSMHNFSTY